MNGQRGRGRPIEKWMYLHVRGLQVTQPMPVAAMVRHLKETVGPEGRWCRSTVNKIITKLKEQPLGLMEWTESDDEVLWKRFGEQPPVDPTCLSPDIKKLLQPYVVKAATTPPPTRPVRSHSYITVEQFKEFLGIADNGSEG